MQHRMPGWKRRALRLRLKRSALSPAMALRRCWMSFVDGKPHCRADLPLPSRKVTPKPVSELQLHGCSSNPASSFRGSRSEEHTSELQSLTNLVCRLLLE